MRVLALGEQGAGRRAWARRDGEAEEIVRLVAAARGVAVEQIFAAARRSAETAEARQLAMYLVHTLLGRTYLETGAVFGRDRTTVSHACAHIEDLRDDRRFDAAVARLEDAIKAAHQAPEPIRAAG